MEVTARGKYLRCSARKMRLIADGIRNLPVDTAIGLLYVQKKTKKSAELVDKVLKSAVANFRDRSLGKSVDAENLKIKSITVDAGPHIKRIRPRAQGRAFHIHKKLCHLTVAISD